MLELVGISKVYPGGKRAVDDVSLRLEPGLLGLLGPNGAGKSSLMRIAATVTRPTSGQLRLDGRDVLKDPDVLRETLGYLPQDFGIYPNLTSREFLAYLAAAKGLPARAARARIDELLNLVNLTDSIKRPLGTFSGGMLRRVGIAQALLADPAVIIVDEPTAGLDPEERVRFRNLLSDLSGQRVVMLSTHIVSDVESVATDLAVVANGRLLVRASPEELLRLVEGVEGQVWEVIVPSTRITALSARYLLSRLVRTSEGVRVRLLAVDDPPVGASPVTADLEDAYLAIVNRARLSPAQAPAARR